MADTVKHTIRQHLIEAHETIIPVMYSGAIQRSYTRESAFFGKVMDEAAVLEELADDDIIAVLRLDTRVWKSEDVTEECAEIYLIDWSNRFGDLDLSDERTLPAFVKNSRAWAVRKDDIEASTPVRPCPDRQYDERRVYSALQDPPVFRDRPGLKEIVGGAA